VKLRYHAVDCGVKAAASYSVCPVLCRAALDQRRDQQSCSPGLPGRRALVAALVRHQAQYQRVRADGHLTINIVMLITMTLRCNQCGHENNPEYRFCGICGAPLPLVTDTREHERTRVSPPVGGPSFLGLGDDRSSDLDYLLDDEPPHGHGRLYLALVLLVISGAFLFWHWQRDGYPWAGLAQTPAAGKTAPSSLPEPEPAPQSAPVTAAPAAASTNGAPGDAPPSPGTASADSTQSAPAGSPAETASPSPMAVVKPPEQSPLPTSSTEPGDPVTKPPLTPSTDGSAPDATGRSIPKETPAVPASAVGKPAKPRPTIPAARPEDRLVDEGERYLYGRGVRSDCSLAQRNLMIGARQSNPKAQTLLGAMYATGHCVNRDLPTAYRWFAKALHGDPANSRVQRDLEVLWKQMTPEERLLAVKSQ
jgi:hypothetical protein